MEAGMTRVCYTALFGTHEMLADQPAADESQVRFVCFTDDPELTSRSWEIVQVDPSFALDPVRSARRLKILGHEAIADADETLWIDAKVQLLADPADVLDEWLGRHDMAVPVHSYRADVVDEFRAVITDQLDDPARLWEQLAHYQITHPEAIAEVPLWTGILARRRTPVIDRAMTTWYEHVLRYSRRDQLSLPVALAEAEVAVHRVVVDNFSSPMHRWPVPAGNRRPSSTSLGSWQTSSAPAIARVRDLEDQIRSLQQVKVEASTFATRLAALEEERDDLLLSLEVREQLLAPGDSKTTTRGRILARLRRRMMRG
jgi:hypothetical protein